MQKLFKRKNKKGFTLAEMLAVIGIIAIILAIAIPTFVTLHRNLVFKRNNDYAKTIFMAAQANLVDMKSNGELKNLSIDGTEDARPISSVASENANFPEEDYSEDYVYTVTGENSFNTILPVGKIDSVVRDGNILIEYNPKSGNVFSVFYKDKGGALSYENVTRGEDARKSIGLGYYQGSGLSYEAEIAPDEVNEAQIIYHDGEEGIVEVIMPVPSSYQSSYDAFVEGLNINLIVSGQVSGSTATLNIKDFNSSKNIKYDPLTKTVSCTYVLDSLNGGMSFASNVTGEKNISRISSDALTGKIQPGENIQVAAEVNFEARAGMPDIIINDINGITINPLFSKLDSGTEGYTLSVRNGRHLQNLNALAPQIAKLVSEVNITNDIYWSTTQTYYSDKYGTNTDYSEAPARALPYFVPINNENLLGSAVFMYPADEDSPEQHYNFIQRILKAIVDFFRTIDNFFRTVIGRAPESGTDVPLLTDETDIDYSTNKAIPHAVVTGGEDGEATARVYDLQIDATKYDLGKDYYAGNDAANVDRFTGLFGYVNTSINGIYVVNPIIKGYYFEGNNNPCTGALVGAAGFNTLIDNSGSFIDTSAPTYSASKLYQNDYSKNGDMNWYGVSGEGAVGGLIGYAKSHRTVSGSVIASNDEKYLAFTNCFAAVNVSGNMRVTSSSTPIRYGYTNGIGGFVGNSQLTNFRDCYASGTVQSHYGYVYRNGNESSSYYLDGKRSYGSGGFVGTSHGTQYYNCFASGNVISNTNSYPSDSNYESVGGFVGVLAYNETHSYGYESESTTAVRQNSLFTNCYSLGTVNDGDSNSGGWRKSIYTRFCGETTTIYAGEQSEIPKGVSYYKMLYTNGKKGYLYKDCYYLDNTFYTNALNNTADECAEPLGYEDLANVIANTQDEDWIKEKARISLDCQNLSNTRWNTTWLSNKGKITPEYQKAYPDSQWGESTVTHPYTMSGTYEFPMVKGMPYYGDWPTVPSKIGLVYYEKYSDGKLGIYAEGKLITTDQKGYVTELDNTKTVVEDGYAVITHASFYYVNAPKVTINGKTYNTQRRSSSFGDRFSLENQYAVRIGLYEYEVMPITGFDYNVTDDSAFTNGFYTKASIKAEVYTSFAQASIGAILPNAKTYTAYFNPNFANTAISANGNYADAVCPEGIPNEVTVRTARQFTNIGKANKYWSSDYNYVQTRDIDATNDDSDKKYGVPACNKIGSEEIPFAGTYTASGEHGGRAFLNGFQNKTDAFFGVIAEGASVKGLDITLTPGSGSFQANGGYTGVFANRIEGSAENIAVTVNGNITTNATAAAGAFAGKISGATSKVTNCSVNAQNIIAENAQYAGGFAGYYEGSDTSRTIQNMNVTVGSITGKAGDENSCTGGFAGLLKNIDVNNVNITTGNISHGGSAGGFAGEIDNVNATKAVVTINGTAVTANANAGGFAGYMKNSTADFDDAVLNISASITASGANGAAGGIVGRLDNSRIFDATVNAGGDITATKFAAGAIGYADGSAIINSINANIGNKRISAECAAGFIAEDRGNPVQGSNVVFDRTTVSGSKLAGGFAGNMYAAVSGSSASGKASVESSSGDAAGFAVVIGSATKRAGASKCYVSPAKYNSDTEAMKEEYYSRTLNDFTVTAPNRAAGFAVEQYGSIADCYALGNITGMETAAGFVCYATGTIDSSMSNTTSTSQTNESRYSFIATNDGGTVTNCYALHNRFANTVSGGDGRYFACYFAENFTGDTRKAKVLVYKSDNEGGKMGNNMLLSDFTMNDLVTNTSTSWEQKDNEPSYPFNSDIVTSYTYPVPVNLGAHYGDWCVPPIYSYGIAYYEEVKSGLTTQLHIKTKDLSNTEKNIYSGALTIDNIDEVTNDKDIISSGYLVYYHGNMPLALSDAALGEQLTQKAVVTGAKAITDAGVEIPVETPDDFNKDYVLYKVVPANNDVFSINVTQLHSGNGSDKSAKILPHFARAISNVGESVANYEIRTEDQLNALAKAVDANCNSFANAAKTFNQTHNVMVSGDITGAAVYNQTNTYNGNNNSIIFGKDAKLNSALFGNIAGGVVKNITVENAVLNAEYTKDGTEFGSNGIIASYVQAESGNTSVPELITNCKVVAPAITITNSSDKPFYAAGIAGIIHDAKVSACEVVDPNYTLGSADSKQTVYLGGITGHNEVNAIIDLCKVYNDKENNEEHITELNAGDASDITLVYGNLVGQNAGKINLAQGTEEQNAIKLNVNYTQPKSIRRDGAETVLMGGIAGGIYNGEIKGQQSYEVGGKFTLTKEDDATSQGRSYTVGGAIGDDQLTEQPVTVSDIHSYVEVSKDFAGSNMDAAFSPATLGSVGKFIGSVRSSNFTNCAGLGNSDAAYQFLGTIAYETEDVSDYWENNAKVDGTTTLEKKNNVYTLTGGTAMAKAASGTSIHSYRATLDNCTYKYSIDDKVYRQYIGYDGKYYYDMANEDTVYYTPATSLVNGKKYAILSSDKSTIANITETSSTNRQGKVSYSYSLGVSKFSDKDESIYNDLKNFWTFSGESGTGSFGVTSGFNNPSYSTRYINLEAPRTTLGSASVGLSTSNTTANYTLVSNNQYRLFDRYKNGLGVTHYSYLNIASNKVSASESEKNVYIFERLDAPKTSAQFTYRAANMFCLSEEVK